jgi:bifunctional non-homologous end joining protein LigD
LLNPIDDGELDHYLDDPKWCLQEKKDGKRLLIHHAGAAIHGINRRGLLVGLPSRLIPEIAALQHDFVIDSEIVGETAYVFDFLQCNGRSLASEPYQERLNRLEVLMSHWELKRLIKIKTVYGPEKRRLFTQLKADNAEGVVFKHLDAPYTVGRPASGGSQLKFKFCADGAFVVQSVNGNRRSVALGAFDGESLVSVGNVTVPPNRSVPRVGEIVQVRYLYAFAESRALFQPVYLSSRDDLEPSECVVGQLKFKPEGSEDDDQ